jgi:beta-lactamase regulating signal transducer with metallopeptidase domain
MDTLLHAGLSNAAAAAVLAVIAAIVGYFCRRPAVRHALWLLVLLKLVTPPLVDVPVPWLANAATPADEPLLLTAQADPEPDPGDVVELTLAEEAEPPADAGDLLPAAAAEEPPAPPPVEWRPLLIAVWLGGSAVWLLLAARQAWRFARVLRHARPAGRSLQAEADEVAERLGLLRAPAVRLLPGRVSPMLWAAGAGARLLLPAELLGRLGFEGRRTLLAHELAHLRRGDHWVRLAELVVTTLFWWHPVVWWARRELREAEEQCCDAWVLWALPRSAKTYALALVETVDFLSEVRPALPALASGVGHVNDLRRRVTMIMQGTTPRALTWSGLLALLGLGAFLLPAMPTWAQQPGDPIRVTVTADGAGQPLRIVTGTALVEEEEDVKKGQPDSAEVQKLRAELERRRAELMKLEAALKAAEMKLKAAGKDTKDGKGNISIEIVDEKGKQLFKLPGGARLMGDKIDAETLDKIKKDVQEKARAISKDQVLRLKAAKDTLELAKKDAEAKGEGKKDGKRIIIEIISDGNRQRIELPPGARIITEDELKKVTPGKGSGAGKGSGGAVVVPQNKIPVTVRGRMADGDTEKRIVDLEKRLQELMRAVKELHGELQKTKPGRPGGGPAPQEDAFELRFGSPLKDVPKTP